MTNEQFIFWLQGCVDTCGPDTPPTPEQWKAIRERLDEVFQRMRPLYYTPLYEYGPRITIRE